MKLRYNSRVVTALVVCAASVLCSFFGPVLSAQTPQFSISETGTASTNSFPWASTGIPIQLLIRPGQINGAYKGKITAIYLKRGTANSSGTTLPSLNIRMSQPATYDFNASFLTYTTGPTVYNGLATIPAGAVNQWFRITLPAPVLYDPALPLLVRICNASITGGFSARTYLNSSGPYHRIYNTNPLGSGCSSPNGYGIDRYLYPFGVDEMPACEVPAGMLTVDLTDGVGSPVAFAHIPGTVYASVYLGYPTGASNVSVKADFFRIGNSTAFPDYSTTVNTAKLDNVDLHALLPLSIPPTLMAGYYRVKFTVNSINTCAEYGDTELPEKAFMLLNAGSEPCYVWPGETNHDGVVNYGDRRALNMYISNANLNPIWLNGPSRYRADAAANPLTYYTWEAQPAVPWQTPEGCHMDCDGNGVVNNFDYIAMKLNWMRRYGSLKSAATAFLPGSFDMDQNYPNPFNPSTTIRYSLPEKGFVTLQVHDMLGREVARLVDGDVDRGVHTAVFNASGLKSGSYLASIMIVGSESGTTFSRTIKLQLDK